MVDLGLSVKWAKYNVGATGGDTAESYYGNFYAWGELETKTNYAWGTYKFGSASPFSKYDTDGKTVLESADDVATTTYGSEYRMPTQAELEELKALPNQWVTDYNGVSGLNGRVFTGNGNTLFIPAAGYFNGTSHRIVGSNCVLWSSSLGSEHANAWKLYFGSGNIGVDYSNRFFGYSVRAIKRI